MLKKFLNPRRIDDDDDDGGGGDDIFSFFSFEFFARHVSTV